jgi:hypothetical protein
MKEWGVFRADGRCMLVSFAPSPLRSVIVVKVAIVNDGGGGGFGKNPVEIRVIFVIAVYKFFVKKKNCKKVKK